MGDAGRQFIRDGVTCPSDGSPSTSFPPEMEER